MNNSDDRPISYSCPYCKGRGIETAATAPYVRGFLLAYQIGTKSFIGCARCVRTRILGEAGLSMLIGWFSITALVINPFLITYNLLQTAFVRRNYPKARKKLSDAGVPEDQSQVNPTQLGYSLAASMIVADGQVDAEEINVARALGPKLFPDFDDEALQAVVRRAKKLPSPQDIASLLREVLTADGKKAVVSYLWLIAKADGVVEESEKKLLEEVATNIGFSLSAMGENS